MIVLHYRLQLYRWGECFVVGCPEEAGLACFACQDWRTNSRSCHPWETAWTFWRAIPLWRARYTTSLEARGRHWWCFQKGEGWGLCFIWDLVLLADSPQTLELVPIYSKISPADPSLEYRLPSEASDSLNSTEEFDFPSTLNVFTETKALELTNKFRRDADAYYVEAKRSTVSSIAQIPYWMYGVLVVLGWNEAMAVLFNPMYFTFLLVALASA